MGLFHILYILVVLLKYSSIKVFYFPGAPKGIVHPQKNLETEVRHTNRINRALISTIMFHLGGFLTPLIIGNNDYNYGVVHSISLLCHTQKLLEPRRLIL